MLHPLPHAVGPPEGDIVRFQGVTAAYEGRPAIEDVTFRVPAGDFVGIVGPSGAGKTTVLRALLGSAEVIGGTVTVGGRPVRQATARIGYVPQIETVDWNFPVTVEQVVLMGSAASGAWWPRVSRQERAHALDTLDRLGIAELAQRHIRRLSGGQQQRVFLARALVRNPELLLLDEPTSGVDIRTRDNVLHLLDELNHQGITILMTTHELNAVAAHLPWVICLNRTLVAEGPPAAVFTPAILEATYGVEMPVLRHEGMTLVGERPHHIGRAAARAPRGAGDTSTPHEHAHEPGTHTDVAAPEPEQPRA
jgi:ABC-type Mn2+/Zn2+ transport system ATPase subunit